MKNILIVLGVIVVAVLIYLGVKSSYGPSGGTEAPEFTDNEVDFGEPSAVPTSSSGLPLGIPTDLVPPSATASPEDGQTVTMSSLRFIPATLTVKQGSTVVFKNDDSVSHTVTATTFNSGTVQPGDSFSQVFLEKGTFPYKCTIHPIMTGTIIVE